MLISNVMRRFLLLLVLYVAVDFANPLMPGAVQFDSGTIEVVHADRIVRPVRPGTDPVHVVAVTPVRSATLEVAALDVPAPRPLLAPVLPARRPVRRPSFRRFIARHSPPDEH
jgi:hypothetical protein